MFSEKKSGKKGTWLGCDLGKKKVLRAIGPHWEVLSTKMPSDRIMVISITFFGGGSVRSCILGGRFPFWLKGEAQPTPRLFYFWQILSLPSFYAEIFKLLWIFLLVSAVSELFGARWFGYLRSPCERNPYERSARSESQTTNLPLQ